MTQSAEVKGVVTTGKAEQNKMLADLADCMAGLTASEHSMIRRLAGNDPEVRRKTVKKLRKWLSSLAVRLPDSSMEECRTLIEPNFIRVWKALFYCMWFADKPIPQEQLAEQLSNLVGVFKKKPCALLLFIEWFFRTVSREWPNIDRFRLDKFMMLIRRFFRSSLTQIRDEYQMRNEILDPFLEIISIYVFNRFPDSLVSKKTRAQLKVPDPVQAPLGFQMHFVDIFMEEVAKVCGEDLKYKKLLRMLKPFIHEMAENDDDRLTTEIKEKIFHYLMRQSDVAMDFQEAKEGNDADSDEEGEEEEAMGGEDGDDKDLSEMVMDDSKNPKKGPLDPRAGAVDVILPQLDVDYEDLVRWLTKAGGRKDVRGKNRKVLYQLARCFEELTGGEYPLGVPKDTSTSIEKRAIKKHDVKDATVRLLHLDEELIEEAGKGKLSKLLKKQKKQNALNATLDNSGMSSGGETSAYIDDTELFDHVDDNYMSYLEEMHQADDVNDSASTRKTKKKLKRKKAQNGDGGSPSSQQPEPSTSSVALNGVKKKAKKRKMQSDESQAPMSPDSDSASAPKRSKNSPTQMQVEENDEMEVSLKLRGKKKRRSSTSFQQQQLPSPPSSPVKNNANATPPSTPSPIKLSGDFLLSNGKMKTPANRNILTPSSVPSSGLRKKVSFVMARNTEHPHADYAQSIQRSPAIPYDADRTPNSRGLLKSPATPGSNKSHLKDFKIPLRKRAAEYF